MRNKDILIVEDNAELSEALSETLALSGYSVTCAANGKEALDKLSRQNFRLIISDIQMSPVDGIQLLESVKQDHPELPVLLMTAYGTIEKAVEAMQLGAVNFMVKPFEADQLALQVSQHIAPAVTPADDVLTRDPKMQSLMKLAGRVAASEASVMIHGESGTGKEVLARFIHNRKAPLPVHIRRGQVSFNRRKGEHSFWMRFPKWMLVCRRNYCVSCKRKRSKDSVAAK